MFYDEIRIGDANASYAAVAPGGGDAVSVGSSRLHRGAATVERESSVYDLRGRAISIAAATGRVAITVVRGSDAAPSTIIGIRR